MRNTLLTTLATLAKEWRVTLQFRPTEYITGSPDGWTSLLHLTIGPNYGQLGARTPAIFLHKDKGLYITGSVNQNYDYYQYFEFPPIGKWTRLEVGQREEDGE